jgi:glucose-6-phosphate isomerase, archaeal
MGDMHEDFGSAAAGIAQREHPMTMEPFATRIIAAERRLDGADKLSATTLKDMADSFADGKAAGADPDRVVYRVSKRDAPPEAGELLQCVTEILPGDCGGECFMTKGHGHADSSCAEIYLGVSGKGLVLMQCGSEFRSEPIEEGRAVYIPGKWNHRTVNVSSTESLVFYSVWPAQSGYDYHAVGRDPFSRRVFRDGPGHALVENH